MKKILTAFLTVLMIVFLLACDSAGAGSSDNDTSNGLSNLPSKLVVNIPDTLQSSASAPGISRSIGGYQSYAYAQVKMTVASIDMLMSSIMMNFVMIDAFLENADISTSEQTGSFTISQAMIDLIIELMPFEDMDSTFESELNKMVGQTYSADFTYTESESSDYDYKFIMPEDDSSSEMTVYWSSDKKRVKNIYEYSYGSSTNSMIFIYNDETKISSMVFEYENTWDGQTYSFHDEVTLQEDSESNKNGVTLTFKNKSADETYGSSSYNASGYADDDGGYIESKLTSYFDWNNDGNDDKWIAEYKEGFDGDGNVNYSAYKDDTTGGSWEESGAIDTSYQDTYEDSYEVTTKFLSGAVSEDVYIISKSALTSDEITKLNNYEFVDTIRGDAYCMTSGEVEIYPYEPEYSFSGTYYFYKVDLSNWSVNNTNKQSVSF